MNLAVTLTITDVHGLRAGVLPWLDFDCIARENTMDEKEWNGGAERWIVRSKCLKGEGQGVFSFLSSDSEKD